VRMIDLFCGLGGATKGFMAEGWECIGYDLYPQPKYLGTFVQQDILNMTASDLSDADFIWCSSPCEQFSVHTMKHFHPNPPYPELGIILFNHARVMCEASGKPYVMENVRGAEKFVGKAVNHCGPFYLWGNAVPAVMPKSIYALRKGIDIGSSKAVNTMTAEEKNQYRKQFSVLMTGSKSKERAEFTSKFAQIPTELSQYIAQCATSLVTA
jgi:hypothetical protein